MLKDTHASAALPKRLANHWSMAEIRKHPLDIEKIGSSRAPFFVKGLNDWMAAGDSWVSPSNHVEADEKVRVNPISDTLKVEQYYFSSESTVDGPNRIYVVLAQPEGLDQSVPAIVVFHGGGGHASPALALSIARQNPGFAVLAVDYNGQFVPLEGQKTTIWRNVNRDIKPNLIPDLKNYPMYHYVIAGRRSIDFLEQQPGIDASKVCSIGISNGGWVGLILAGVDERVKCVVNAVSAGGVEGTSSRMSQAYRLADENQKQLYLDTYDPISYAKYTKAAVLIKLSSNDRFMWLTAAMRNFAELSGDKRVIVTPNSDHNEGGPAIPDPSMHWIRQHLLQDASVSLPRIRGDRLCADGNQYTWEAEGALPIVKSILYWSPGKTVCPARYWLEIEARQFEGKWTATIPESFAAMAGQVYATVFDQGNRAVSSMLANRDGNDLQQSPLMLWHGHSVWDLANGASAWRPYLGSRTKILTATDGGISFISGNSATIASLTNSAVLASGFASIHKGIRLQVDGNGRGGSMKVSLVRDINSLDEIIYTATVSFEEGETVIHIPWSDYHPSKPGAVTAPWPFDSLLIEASRDRESPLTIRSIRLFS